MDTFDKADNFSNELESQQDERVLPDNDLEAIAGGKTTYTVRGSGDKKLLVPSWAN